MYAEVQKKNEESGVTQMEAGMQASEYQFLVFCDRAS